MKRSILFRVALIGIALVSTLNPAVAQVSLDIPPVDQSVPTSTPPTTTPPIVPEKPFAIDEQLLESAGFTGATVQPQIDTRFDVRLHYFRVAEKVAGPDSVAWGDVADLVTIYVGELWRPDIDLAPEAKQTSFAGRFQLRKSVGTSYIVVTGPDVSKVENLMTSVTQGITRVY